MDARVMGLLRRFVEIESAEEIVTTVPGPGRPETVRRPHATVVRFVPERGLVELRHDDRTARLHLAERELLHVLEQAARDGRGVWGAVSAQEAGARFLSVWLDECLATREPHPTGSWTLRNCWFVPVPPWEASPDR